MALMSGEFLRLLGIDPERTPGMVLSDYAFDVWTFSNRGGGRRTGRRVMRRAFQRQRAEYLLKCGHRLWKRRGCFRLAQKDVRPSGAGWSEV